MTAVFHSAVSTNEELYEQTDAIKRSEGKTEWSNIV
jgi:hypothetical protein